MAALGIVTGLAVEARIVAHAARGDARVVVRCHGPGQRAARAAAESLLAERVSIVLSFGLAGGLDPGLAPGDITVAPWVAVPGGQRVATDDALRQRLLYVLALGGVAALERGVASSRRAVASTAEKRALAAATGAAAVDMESAGVAEIARANDLRLVIVRAIVDPAHRTLPDAAIAATARDGRTRPLALLGSALARPREMADLARLVVDYARARAGLRRVAPLVLATLVEL